MKRRIAAVFSYGFARLLMTLLSAIQIGVWCLLAVPSLFSRKVREILSKWRDKGWMCGGAGSYVNVTKWFWLAMNEILFVAYVDIL